MDEEARQPVEHIPGCGLAAFALLLLTIFLIGITGVSVVTYSVFTSGQQLSPQLLAYGGLVDASMLAPMREAGLLGPDEVPDAYHAEDPTGESACALSGGKLLRLERGVGTTLALDTMTEVREEDGAVVVVGEKTVRCPFGEGEGGDRFVRMLRNR